MYRGRMLDQREHDPPGLLDAVLAGEGRAVALNCRVQQDLVGRRTLAALLGELHVERDLVRAAAIGAMRVDDQADAGRRVELDHELALDRLALSGQVDEPEPRRPLEHEPTSVCVAGRRLPVRMNNGTPDQRQLSISSRIAA